MFNKIFGVIVLVLININDIYFYATIEKLNKIEYRDVGPKKLSRM